MLSWANIMFKVSKIDLLVILFFVIFSYPFLFYKLGQSSLTSFDEAWYASIAQNILVSKNLVHLKFNDNLFFDHPPFAIWLTSLSFLIFGVNAFAARLPSALFSLFTLIIVYFLGSKMFNKVVGFCSALALLSANWFLFRARSGNLDSVLTFLFVLNFYLAFLFNQTKNVQYKKYLSFLGAFSLVALFLTKTMVPLTILPVLFVMLFSLKNLKFLLFSTLIFSFVLVFCVYLQLKVNNNYINRYLAIGTPGVGFSKLSFFEEIKFLKDYLYFGIGKWFWPGILGIFGGLLLFQKRFFYLAILFVSFISPFLFSQKAHIWHLIPIFPFMILAAFGFLFTVVKNITFSSKFAYFFIVLIAFYFTKMQLTRNYNEFINIDKFISEEEILSREAAKYDTNFIIDGDFVPTAAFYSGKKVKQTYVGGIKDLFNSQNGFVLITKDWRLKEEGILDNEYVIIKQDRDKILIWKKS